MIRIAFTCLSTLVSLSLFGQDIIGQWNGSLNVNGSQLRIVFHIEQTTEGYSSTLDSPDQNAYGIPTTSTSFVSPNLKILINNLMAEYNGELKDGKFIGEFKQRGQVLPMELSREIIEKKEVVRPQKPVKPYPYLSEDIVFENKQANIELAGTLTIPQNPGKYPAVVLISGSGPQDRNEEIYGHQPFYVLSDYLTKKGIAVLRFDDRGVNKSKGDFASANTFDFATDVEAAVAYLKTRKEVDAKKIGLVGHSEGGIIAPIVASRSKDVDYIVLLAGTGLPGDQIILMQTELIMKGSGAPESEIEKARKFNKEAFDIVRNSATKEETVEKLKAYLKDLASMDDDQISQAVSRLTDPWMALFLVHDPAPVLEKVNCPVLAINGEKDLQVPPKENLLAIENALKKAKNKKYEIKEYPNLNHLFQECETGLPSEYPTIEQTFSPIAMEDISNWILKTAK